MQSLVEKKKKKLLIRGIAEDQMLYLYLKKGSSDDLGNYRSVSSASVSGKLVGTIIKKQHWRHLEDCGLIGPNQRGFSRGKRHLANLLQLFECVDKAMDKGGPIDIMCLDFQKAFERSYTRATEEAKQSVRDKILT